MLTTSVSGSSGSSYGSFEEIFQCLGAAYAQHINVWRSCKSSGESATDGLAGFVLGRCSLWVGVSFVFLLALS